MTIKKCIVSRRAFIYCLPFLFLFILTAQTILAAHPDMRDDKYGGWRWFRVEPPKISKKVEYIVGVTPNYYSARNKGSYNKYSAGETFFTHKCLWKDRVGTPSEVLEADVLMRADFQTLPGILVPEDTIYLPVNVSGTGSSPGRGTQIQFEYSSKGVALHGTTQVSTGSGTTPPFITKSINPYFVVPVPNASSGEISITAFLWNSPCSVTWTYKARQISPTSTQARGVITEPRGFVEHYIKAFKKWKGPIRGQSQIYSGDRIRTGPNSSCLITFTNRRGRQDTIFVGSDTLIEVPEIPELQPRLSITSQIWRGIIKIKKALLREPPSDEEFSEFTFRTRSIVLGVRGTEFILQANDDGTSEVFLKEGAVEITNLKTNQKTFLQAGQRMIVRSDGSEERGLMTTGLWDSFINSHFSGETDKTSEFDVISLRAQVKDLNFYESGYDELAKNQRAYKTEFLKSESRYINWELNFVFSAPGRRIDFDIIAIWYQPDGSVMTKQTKASYIESNWTNSYHNIGWGWREPGNWTPGTYLVELLVEGQKIASGSFRIVQ